MSIPIAPTSTDKPPSLPVIKQPSNIAFVFFSFLLEGAAAQEPPITAAAFSPKRDEVVVGSQTGVHVYSWPDLKPTRKLETRLIHIHDLVFSPDGGLLLAGGGSPAESGEIEVFTWPQGRLRLHRSLGNDLIYCVTWKRDSSGWIVAGADRRVMRCDQEGNLQTSMVGHSRAVLAAELLPDTNILVSAGRDQSLRVWDATSGKLLRTLANHTAAVRAMAVRPDRQGLLMIASAGDDRTVRLWQPTIGRMVRFARLPSPALNLAWTPQGDRLLVSSVDGAVRLIDPDTVEIKAEIAALDRWAFCVCVGENGDRALVAGAGGMKIVRIPAIRND